MSRRLQAPRGTFDVLGDAAQARADLERVARQILERAGYERAETPVFEPTTVQGATGGAMTEVRPDPSAFRSEYDPGHPAADAQGYVKLPNVEPLTAALDMRQAQRAYEANLNVIETARAMESRTLDLIRK